MVPQRGPHGLMHERGPPVSGTVTTAAAFVRSRQSVTVFFRGDMDPTSGRPLARPVFRFNVSCSQLVTLGTYCTCRTHRAQR